ncbi:peptidase U62 modulator of DNA gyrase [Thalassoporum mexicanum PCC 7367]|uniref:TldD/PmbA family protein n=1 Tax=Thalassoporum mexicanum TaxID=3457544 RepID=UPI00029FDB0E|nr:TldD/PmbA family protein [Pseudanabaena sp. PCC 7367]AFY69358.1 peptidase U62 modulator of DNA gyrase [Pseudanabaena sp. PCC 7367]
MTATIARETTKSTLNIDDLANQVKTIADRLGISKYDIYGSTVDETEADVYEGSPKQVGASNRSSITVRVWSKQNTVGVTSTTDIDPAGLELALKTAAEASAFGVTEHVPDFSPEAIAPLDPAALERIEHKEQIADSAPIQSLLDILLSAEKELVEAHEAIEAVPYNGMSQKDVIHFYLNSAGAKRQEAHSVTTLFLYAQTTEAGGKKPRSGSAYRLSIGLDGLDIRGCIEETKEKTISHYNYQKITTGKYKVVFSAKAFLSLLYAFSNLFNAQNILDKQSLSTPESIGNEIASPALSVFDDELHSGNVAASAFDGEGTPTRRVPVITAGKLTNFLHSAGTAKRLNAKPTGHATMGAKVSVSPSFLHVLPGETENAAYDLAKLENVVFIDELQALHAGVNALQGSLSLPFKGWIVNKGDRTSIESATVAGDILDLLKSIAYIEPTAKVTPRGVSPRVWIDSMAITGD